MIRLFKIEYRKILGYKAFWIFLGIYFLSLVLSCWAIPELTDEIGKASNNNELKLLKYLMFNFPDIWQNISFALSLRYGVKVLLAMIVIVNICNEFSYKTLRQNIVCGMERVEILKGKIILIVLLTLVSTLMLIASGLYLGLSNSSTLEFSKIIGKSSFLVAYMIEIFTFLSFALLLGFLIRKAGFAIIALFFTPILEVILKYKVFPESWSSYLPIEAMNKLITSPNTSLIEISNSDIPFELQKQVDFTAVLPILGYLAIFYGIMWFMVRKQDY